MMAAMGKRAAVLVAVVLGSSAIGYGVACSSSDGGGGAPDAGGDAPTPPLPPLPPPPPPEGDGGGDAGLFGTKLSPGSAGGITSDDFAFVADNTDRAFYAVPAAGGARQKVCDGIGSIVALGGKALYCVTSTLGVPGPLYVWTSAHGSVKVASADALPANPSVKALSPDGTHVLFSANVTGAAGAGDVTVANADGTGTATTLVAGVSLTTTHIGWAGTHAVVASSASPDAASGADVATFDSANAWTKASLATGAIGMASTAAASTVAVIASDGSLATYPVGGGAATPIDTAVTQVDMLADGLTLVYGTTAGALQRVAVTGGTPTTLVASGFVDKGIVTTPAGVLAVSPDGKMMLVGTNDGTNDQLALLSATKAATPTLLVGSKITKPTTTFTSLVVGDAFTADSAFALFNAEAGGLSYQTYAVPVATGVPFSVDTAQSRASKYALGGSSIAYSVDGAIRTVDLTKPTSVKDVAQTQFGGFFTTAARDRIVYTLTTVPAPDPNAAVYSIAP
jgi:hypothetical protein